MGHAVIARVKCVSFVRCRWHSARESGCFACQGARTMIVRIDKQDFMGGGRMGEEGGRKGRGRE